MELHYWKDQKGKLPLISHRWFLDQSFIDQGFIDQGFIV